MQAIKAARGFTLIEAKPKTGRTHQIRVHFQSLQRAVVCDKLYAASKPSILGFDRLALHARQVVLEDMNGDKQTLVADFPEDFKSAFQQIGYKVK